MKTVFLDTVGLIALWDSTDQWHPAAVSMLDHINQPDCTTITTTFILAECANAASRRPYRGLVDELRVRLEEGQKLITPTRQDWDSAWAAYRRGKPGEAGFIDHVSFVVMRRLHIDDAFTNDRHFKAAGFNTLF